MHTGVGWGGGTQWGYPGTPSPGFSTRVHLCGKVSLLSISFHRSTRQVTTDNSHRLFKNVFNLLNVRLLVHRKLKCSNKFTDLGEINWVTFNNDKYYHELCSEIMKWKVTKSNFTTSNVCKVEFYNVKRLFRRTFVTSNVC